MDDYCWQGACCSIYSKISDDFKLLEDLIKPGYSVFYSAVSDCFHSKNVSAYEEIYYLEHAP